eukprot:1161561-Pelagomonas_calceolata.AAC.2
MQTHSGLAGTPCLKQGALCLTANACAICLPTPVPEPLCWTANACACAICLPMSVPEHLGLTANACV